MHTCHARGCVRVIPPRLLMCAPHWRMVPMELRRQVMVYYRLGQETDKKPSPMYLKAMRAAIDAVAALEAKDRERTPLPIPTPTAP